MKSKEELEMLSRLRVVFSACKENYEGFDYGAFFEEATPQQKAELDTARAAYLKEKAENEK